jgi:MFS family permease
VIACLAASRLRIPLPHAAANDGPARPLGAVVRQPLFIVAVAIGAISYGSMSLLMTATPLAMQVCGFGYPDAADVIQWHVIAMFAPGLVTGRLLQRFGRPQVMLVGCGLMFTSVAIAHAGIGYWHFWSALVALGIGWNFMFVGATALLTSTYRASERAHAQGINDLVVFLTMITSSAASGALVSASGWTDLNLYALPALVLATGGVLYAWRVRPAAATVAA